MSNRARLASVVLAAVSCAFGCSDGTKTEVQPFGVSRHALITNELAVDSVVMDCAAGRQSAPFTVGIDGGFLVVWEDERGTTKDIYAGRVLLDGGMPDPWGIRVAGGPGDQKAPAFAHNDAVGLYVWNDGDAVRAARTTYDGIIDATPLIVSPGAFPSGPPSVVWDGANFRVAWSENRAGTHDLFSATVTAGGTVGAVSPFIASPGDQVTPVFSRTASSLAVFWFDTRTGATGIYGARISASGASMDGTGVFVVNNVNARPFAAASDGTDHVIVHVTGVGTPTGLNAVGVSGAMAPATITPVTSDSNQDRPSLVWAGANYAVTWINAQSTRVMGRRLTSIGSPIEAGDITLETSSNSVGEASTGLSGPWLLTAWRSQVRGDDNIYVSSKNQVLGAQLTGRPVSTAASTQTYPVPAFDGENFVVGFNDTRGAYYSSTFRSRISRAATLVDANAIRVSNLSGRFSRLAAASSGGNALVAWSETGNQFVLEMIRSGPDGGTSEPSGGSVVANATGFRPSPAAAYGGGQYALVWTVNGVNVRFINPSGTPGPLTYYGIGTGTTAEYPSATSDGTDFLLTWMERNANFDFDVRAARVAVDGGRVGPIFGVGTVVGVDESVPATAFGDGRYVVAWEEGLAERVRASVLAADGGREIGPVLIATDAGLPAVEWDGRQFIIAFSLQGPESVDVYVRTGFVDGGVLQLSALTPIATTPEYEGNVRLASDKQGRTLVVYEKFEPATPISNVRAYARLIATDVPLGGACVADFECVAGSCVSSICQVVAPDAGSGDAGSDAGADAGSAADAGTTPDAGEAPDAGNSDGGAVDDAGTRETDGGHVSGDAMALRVGCEAGGASAVALGAVSAFAALLRRRRR